MDLESWVCESVLCKSIRGGKQYWMRLAALMEFGLYTIDMNGRGRMESNWSDDSYSLSVFNEWRVYPVEWTCLFHDNTLECLNSLYRIPNDMFCSSHSYLLFMSWPAFMGQLVCIPYELLLHLLSPNDFDRNPFSNPTVHTVLLISMCSRLSCIPIPICWFFPSYLWFLLHCWSPACQNACIDHDPRICCSIRLLLLTMTSILFLDSMETKWGVQQHPPGQGHRWGYEHDEWGGIGPQYPSTPWRRGCCC